MTKKNLKLNNLKKKILGFARFSFWFVILLFAFLFLNLNKAQAQSFSLGVYPPILEIIAKPGAQVVFPIKIFNTGDDLSLKLTLVSFTAKNEAGHIEILPTASRPWLDWITLQSGALVLPSNRAFTLKAGQEQEFKLKIAVPENIPPADFYFLLLWQSQSLGESKETSSQAAGQLGLPVLLTVFFQDEYPVEGQIEEFWAPGFLETGPVPFILRVKNTGRFHFAPQGKIEIKNMLGKKAGEVTILPQNILAGTTRALTDTPQASPSSIFNFHFSIFNSPKVIWSSGLLLGKYTAEVKLALADWGPQISAQTTFWVFPVKGAAGVLVAIILLLLIGRRIRKIGVT